MLVTTTDMFKKAQKDNFAIPAPNFFDFSSAKAFTMVAEKLNKPLILAFAQAHMDMLTLEDAAAIGKYLANQVEIPVALHLDHGTDPTIIKKAVDLGFTSVMIDASQDDFKSNVARSQEIVAYAHPRGVVVEAEIGHVGSGVNYENHENTDSIYTELADAENFIQETAVDSLAISIGTAHGFYKGTPQINFERLQEIKEACKTPLVLHGGSSSGDENLHGCATKGIAKVNIFTDFISAAQQALSQEESGEFFQQHKVAYQGMADTLAHYYEVFATGSWE